ncbi:ABC transporter ATP-binding protein [Alicyclobacillus mengziensis]|uniref:ABC transporter ATP-binding protein n=1 Tax=Alicyclobacillus mengziensis TaxID=2931921 RepID=A0A9X7W068_9BACL|nr:ABC transporter ATP-binding protein [Alicyclobacillus mengziensis]QSO47835.1 ABC transporter ATP-binding protein [Alicyclobacillus mengziensis]
MNARVESIPAAKVAVAVRGLNVVYSTNAGEIPAVNNVDIDILAGKITGIIGESGSGKSTLMMGVMNAINKPGRITSGSVLVDGVGDMLKLDKERQRKARGKDMGFVFQAAQNSLNPLRRIGNQVLDLGRSHNVKDLRALIRRAKELLTRLGLDADRVLASYQHELSGGMRQRVGIMFALVLDARIVILDEATTALDMLSQASVLEIVRELHEERGLTTILITHDMGVVADLADRVAVMYGGEIVEQGSTEELLRKPKHPYTQGLIGAIPRITGDIDLAVPLKGSPPDVKTYMQPGCLFAGRCPLVMDKCRTERPTSRKLASGRDVSCFRVSDDD